jgi:hypothetical protein
MSRGVVVIIPSYVDIVSVARVSFTLEGIVGVQLTSNCVGDFGVSC